MRDRIQPYIRNPFYWQYQDQPVMLLGGSVEDNLFQVPNVEAHLDLLHSVGGNFVRCTMSSRDPGDVWPFDRDSASGLYDLNLPGTDYWQRFERFMELTAERRIFVQFEVWDRFDFTRAPWLDNPFNPKNNVNYTTGTSGLAERYDTHPGQRENPFFRSVPMLENNEVLLQYQHAHVDRFLSVALTYDHVLFCIDNETNESPEWGKYWVTVISEQAQAVGTQVEVTEMWDAWDILHDMHRATLDHPELYTFIDISQNNQNAPHDHWANLLEMRKRVATSGTIRPMNNVKVYGATTGKYGSTRDGQERFWRGIFGGLAAVRFHRPESGLGLGEIAQSNIRSARMLADVFPLHASTPRPDLVDVPAYNEIYCLAGPDHTYAVYFPDGGRAFLQLGQSNPTAVRWLDIRRAFWHEPESHRPDGTGILEIRPPADEGYWVALIHANGSGERSS